MKNHPEGLTLLPSLSSAGQPQRPQQPTPSPSRLADPPQRGLRRALSGYRFISSSSCEDSFP